MKLNDLRSKITDLQLRIDDLTKSTQDPKDALAAAKKELSIVLKEIDIAQKEPLPQDEDLQQSLHTVEALRHHYLELFNLMPEGWVITDLKGTIREANITASSLLRSKITGVPLAAFLKEDNLDDLETNLDCLKKGEMIRDWEVKMHSTDGTAIPVSISANAIPDLQKRPSCLIWLIHDMTKQKKVEEALRESEEIYRLRVEDANKASDIAESQLAEERLRLFRSAVTNANDGVVILMPDPADKKRPRIEYINQAFLKMTGYDELDIIGRCPEILSGPDTDPARIAEIKKALLDKQPTRVERINYRKDGTKFWSELSLFPLLNKAGEVDHWVSIERDTTDRRRNEEELKEAKRVLHENLSFLQRLADTIPSPVFYTGLNGRYLGCNKAFEELLGLRSEDIMGRSEYELMPKDMADKYHEINQALFSGSGTQVYETPIQNAKGIFLDFVINKATYTDADGAVAGIVGVMLDITEHKRAEEALAFKNIIFRTQQELSLEGILVVDEHDKILSSNQRFVDMWGIPLEVIESGSDEHALLSVMDKLASPEEFMRKVKHIREVRDKTSRDEIVLKDGRSFDCYSAPMLSASGRYCGRVLYFRDITDLKQAEELRERLVKELEAKNIEMERFIYTVSHDLRSPLLTINGFVGFLESDLAKGSSERVKVDLKMISSAISKMDRFLKDTLELSRIGRVTNPPEIVPFTEIVQEAMDQMSEKIRVSGVQVKIKSNLPFVNVDRMRMVEVLTNLIENSIKYMGGQPHPSIEVGCRVDGEENVFFVKDNGMGIDPSQHDKVFGLFYKVDKKSEGSGAGLAIVKRIIEIHGGRIWVESEVGKGCTVSFNLPVAR